MYMHFLLAPGKPPQNPAHITYTFSYRSKGAKVHQTGRTKLEVAKLVPFNERVEYVESEGSTEGAKQLQVGTGGGGEGDN